MIRRLAHTTMLTAFLLGVFAPAGFAVSSIEIHKDAADCLLDDRDYTLQELRAADRTVGADQREYGCWDEPYAAYLRLLAQPKGTTPEPPVIKPKDTNRNGKIDVAEKKEAEKQNKAVRKQFRKKLKEDRRDGEGVYAIPDGGSGGSDFSGDTDSDRSESTRSSDEDGFPWGLALLAIPLAILGFGAYRLQRANRAKTGAPARRWPRPKWLPGGRRASRPYE